MRASIPHRGLLPSQASADISALPGRVGLGATADDASMNGEQPNRRNSPRHTSTAVAYVAPIDSSGKPLWTEIKATQCHDLSRGGISFSVPEPLATDQFVVMLGSKQVGWTYMRAELVYCKPVDAVNTSFLVGCKFVGRMEGQHQPQ